MSDPQPRTYREIAYERRVVMADTRSDVHRLQLVRDLTDAEFLLILAEIQVSILGRVVHHEIQERVTDG